MSRRVHRVSQAAFARAAGISRRQVARHIAAGVLELAADGLLDLAAGKRALKAQRQKREDAGDAADAAAAELRTVKRELIEAQRDWRQLTGELRRLELLVKRGEYVPLADVQRDARNATVVIQSVLRSIPQRTAMEVSAALEAQAERRAAVVEHIIGREIERAIGTLAESIYIKPTGETLTVVCGHCATRQRQDDAAAARRAELAADGVVDSWQDVLRAALERALAGESYPHQQNDVIDETLLPLELRSRTDGLFRWLNTSAWLTHVARFAFEERLQIDLARDRARGNGDRK